MKTDLMFSTNPSPGEEAKTKQQTKKPYSNHVEQLSTQNTTGKEEVSETESTPAALHGEISLQSPGAGKQRFCYIFLFVFKVSQHQHWCCKNTDQ